MRSGLPSPPLTVNGVDRHLYGVDQELSGPFRFGDPIGVVQIVVTIEGWVNEGDVIAFQGQEWKGLVREYTSIDNIAKVVLSPRNVPKI